MIYLVKPFDLHIRYACNSYGTTGACGTDCSSKCFLCSCNAGYGSCTTAVLT